MKTASNIELKRYDKFEAFMLTFIRPPLVTYLGTHKQPPLVVRQGFSSPWCPASSPLLIQWVKTILKNNYIKNTAYRSIQVVLSFLTDLKRGIV